MANLTTTTLTRSLSTSDRQVTLASVTGVTAGMLLFVDGEACRVRVTPTTTTVAVSRGQQGTRATEHVNGATVYAGSPTQFYTRNPMGAAPTVPLANPWINLTNGTIWYAIGDEVGPGATDRAWQQVTSTPTITAFGARTVPTLTGSPVASS